MPLQLDNILLAFRRRTLWRYSAAISVVVLTIFLKFCILHAWGQGRPYLLGALAVTICAWLGGRGPGLLATALLAGAIHYLFSSIDPSITAVPKLEVIGIVQFVVECAIITILIAYVQSTLDSKRATELALHQAKEAADAANLAKSAFLANMSHEIRSPLAAILGFTDLLRRDETTPAEKTLYSQTIKRNGQLLERLIDDILDLSKIEVGRLEIEKIAVPLSPLVSDILTLFQQKARTQQTKLTAVQVGRIPKVVLTDPTRVRQILINIVGNAVKFTDQGEVTLSLQYDMPSKILRFLVTDTGPGLSPEQSARLFLPFVQADVSTTRRYGGSGLGLILSRRLARLLGGDVVIVASEIGKGTTVAITVDVSMVAAEGWLAADALMQTPGLAESDDGEAPSLPILSGLQVLVAEDMQDNQILIRRLLQRHGIAVSIAADGQAAVEAALGGGFDAVLMDLQMPVMDGYEATRELRRQGYRKPIIALTAHAMKEEQDRSLAAGCTAHLTKPIKEKNLLTMLGTYTQAPPRS